MYFWAFLYHASAAPLDAAGAYQHVVTLQLPSLVSPGPIGPGLRIVGGDQQEDVATFVGSSPYGTEVFQVDEDGSLLRVPIRFAAGASGPLTVKDGVIRYCRLPGTLVAVDLRTGAQTDEFSLGRQDLCGVYRGLDGGWVLDIYQHPAVAVLVGAKGQKLDELPILQANGARTPEGGFKAGLRPCGDDGVGPIAVFHTYRRDDGYDVTLARLGPDLLPAKTIWQITAPSFKQQPAWDGFHTMRVCTARGDEVVFASHGEVWVFEGKELVSVIRAGTPLEQSNVKPAPNGPWTVGNVSWVGTPGDLLLVGNLNGVLRIYAKGTPNPKTRLGRVQAHPHGDPVRLQAMYELGWWSAVVDESQPSDPWFARSRGRQILHWTHGGPPDKVWTIGNVMKLWDPELLTEVDTLLVLHPDEALLHYARARLLRRLDRGHDALAALAEVERTMQVSGLSAAEVPDLFDLAEQRGDAPTMKRLLAAADGRERLMLLARWHRIRREPDRVIELLEPLGRDDPGALALVALAQADRGELDQALTSWTRIQPQTASGLGAMGLAYLRRGLTELAIEALTRAVDADPKNVDARSNLAAAYAALDKRGDAMKQLYAALAEFPDDPVLQHQLQPAVGDTQGSLAVLPFDIAGGTRARVGMGSFIATLATTALVERGSTVVERARLDALLLEHDLQLAQFIDPERAVRFGKGIGARWLVTGNAAEFGDRVVLDLRLIDVETGKIERTATGTASLEIEALRAEVDSVLTRLVPQP